MTNLDGIIGDVIFLSFGDIDRFKDIGITKPSGHFLLKGYDQMGLWLEHPGIVIFHTEDDEGNPIPAKQHTKEKVEAEFIVTWDNINTIMHYPEREGFDFPSEFKKKFGFRFEDEEKPAKQ